MKTIYRTYADTETVNTITNLEYPYFGNEFYEYDMDECGRTYEVECEKCEKRFKMHFDAS